MDQINETVPCGEISYYDDYVVATYHYDSNKIKEKIRYDKNMNRHCDDGPAYTSYYQNGDIRYEQWFLNGINHRISEPAIIMYNNGIVVRETWFKNGFIHRIDGPAHIEHYEHGIIANMYWYIDGKLHRDDEPAVTIYDETGDVVSEKFYNNGICINQ
jgi:antitoxin component YwqK of YwqJK toxin-antitoxin module